MIYAYVTDGTVAQAGRLPRSWNNPDGTSVSGFHLLDDESLRAAGWYPVEDGVQPTPGDGEQVVADGYTVEADRVVRQWKVEPAPPGEPDPQEAFAAAVEAATTIAELKAALLGKGDRSAMAAAKGKPQN